MRILSGRLRGRHLPSPVAPNCRPTTSWAREGYFSHVAPLLLGTRFLDLFAGTGIMGFEAWSRGAKEVLFIEADARQASGIRQCSKEWDVEGRVITGKVERVLKRLVDGGKRFTLIYADPPYGFTAYENLLETLINVVEEGEIAIEARRPHPLEKRANRLLTYGKTVIACFLPQGGTLPVHEE